MAICSNHICKEVEYGVDITNTSNKYVGPKNDEDKCLKGGNGKKAEKEAEANLKKAIKAQGDSEKTECPGQCDCIKGKWSDWEVTDRNQQWKEDITLPDGCKFEVTITYNRKYKEQTGECILKPPKSPK